MVNLSAFCADCPYIGDPTSAYCKYCRAKLGVADTVSPQNIQSPSQNNSGPSYHIQGPSRNNSVPSHNIQDPSPNDQSPLQNNNPSVLHSRQGFPQSGHNAVDARQDIRQASVLANETLSVSDPATASGSLKKGLMSIPRNTKIIAAGIAAVIAVVGGFFLIGSTITSPDRLVKKYFLAISSGQYAEAFQYLAHDTTDFINPESFSKYMEESGDKTTGMTSFNIFENPSSPATESAGGKSRTYTVRYAVENVTSQSNMKVTLVAEESRRFLLFSQYAVSLDSALVDGYTITVPKGSSVSINGIPLKNPSPAEEIPNSGDFNMDRYTVPPLFAGQHELKVTSNLSTDYVAAISINSYQKNTTVFQLPLKEDLRAEFAELTEDYYKRIFNGALAGKSFDSLGIQLTSNRDQAERLRSMYNEFLNTVQLKSDGTGYKSVSFRSFTDRAVQEELNTMMTYNCSMEVRYDALVTKSVISEERNGGDNWFDRWFGRERTRQVTSNSDQTLTNKLQNINFEYAMENGDWVLLSMSLSNNGAAGYNF
jgi:hypothetical protein